MSDVIPPRPDGPPPVPVPPMPSDTDRPKATWRWWEAVLVYLGITLVSSLVTLPLFQVIRSKGLVELVASLLSALVIIGLLVLWLRASHPGWQRAIGFPKRLWPEVRAGLGFGLLLYPVVTLGVGLIVTMVLQVLSGHTVRSPRQIPSHLSAVGVTVSVVYAVLVAPIHEEFFFRGILFRSLRDRHGFWVGALGSGAAFGLIHYLPAPWFDSLLLMLVMVFTGFALAYLYERRGNIVANMVAHAMFNVVGMVLILVFR